MKILNDFLHLFYPKLCAVCDQGLIANEITICTNCRHDLPLTNIKDYNNNDVLHKFYGRIPIEKAYSLLFFRKKGSTQKLIHNLKYKGNEDIGVFFGNWLGELLKENHEFNGIDYIIPVPLHPKKLKERGYNQVTKFGEKLSCHLNIPLIKNNLIRTSLSKTQTAKDRFERFKNVETNFALRNPAFFDEKHILIIDDIITTGATLEACAKEFSKSKNCKISILTMAYKE